MKAGRFLTVLVVFNKLMAFALALASIAVGIYALTHATRFIERRTWERTTVTVVERVDTVSPFNLGPDVYLVEFEGGTARVESDHLGIGYTASVWVDRSALPSTAPVPASDTDPDEHAARGAFSGVIAIVGLTVARSWFKWADLGFFPSPTG